MMKPKQSDIIVNKEFLELKEALKKFENVNDDEAEPTEETKIQTSKI